VGWPIRESAAAPREREKRGEKRKESGSVPCGKKSGRGGRGESELASHD